MHTGVVILRIYRERKSERVPLDWNPDEGVGKGEESSSVPREPINRQIFYNNSSWDSNLGR